MAEEVSLTPWWWQDVDETVLPAREPPAAADIVVIGGGYTGLSAALTLAEAGREVVLLEAGLPGRAASGLNGGMVGAEPGLDFFTLERRYGRAKAAALVAEGLAALRHLEALLSRTGIDAGYRACGRFKAAVSAEQFAYLQRHAQVLGPLLRIEPEVVPAARMGEHLDSRRYHGGIVWPIGGGLHPYKLAQGMVRVAQAAGAVLVPHCPVFDFRREAGGYRLETPMGTVRSRCLVLASNALSPPAFRYLRRRQVPVGSYMIATEAIGENAVRAAIPSGRMIVDGFRRLHYYRASPDGTRILFGGRPQLLGEGVPACGAVLQRHLRTLLPALDGVAITHAWTGQLGFSFDWLPHIDEPWPGAMVCGGYGGSGVAMSLYLGSKAGLRLLGRAEAATAFDDLPFRTRAFHNGRPWFLPAVMGWYALRDRIGM